MRPGTCGVTVTDSNAPLRPISSRYVGTARETAGAAVTSGAMGGDAAACAFSRLHAVAAVSAPSTLRVPTAANPRAAARANTRETNARVRGQLIRDDDGLFWAGNAHSQCVRITSPISHVDTLPPEQASVD